MKRLLFFFKNLLFPPKCVGCREFIQKNLFEPCEIPLCEKCRVMWEYEKLAPCPDCGLEMTLCNCGSRLLKKLNVDGCAKLVNYSAVRKSVGKSAVLYMKKHKNKRAFDYFAKQLSYTLYGRLKELERKKAIIAFVPRSRKSFVKFGVDQSKEIAKRLSRLCGIDLACLFVRRGTKSAEQKKLSLSERIENAKNAYKISRNAVKTLENVDTVFVVDDVLTSGASLAGCIFALKEVYKGKIVCVTLARTGKKQKNN